MATVGAPEPPRTLALDIAIDHRIRELFRPVSRLTCSTGGGDHVNLIKRLGRKLKVVGEDEIRVTAQLVGPFSTGGIMVVLQQPRQDHPFQYGIQEVIGECITFMTLQESFAAASCDTLDIVHDIAIIDLLPYITAEDMDEIDDDSIQNIFEATFEIILQKRPTVVFCLGKIPTDIPKGDLRKIESVGVGNTFHSPFATVWDDSAERQRRLERVNGFHPSSAMNYFPEHSCLRQLFLLETAQACARQRDDWREEPWMIDFRALCKATFSHKIGGRKYIPDYSDFYFEKIDIIQETIRGIAAELEVTSSGILDKFYNTLVGSRLSEHCNDACLILAKLAELEENGWPERYDSENERNLIQVATQTRSLAEDDWGSDGWLWSDQLEEIVLDTMECLKGCIEVGYGGCTRRLDLEQASKVFLRMAELLETLLWEIRRGEYEEEVIALS